MERENGGVEEEHEDRWYGRGEWLKERRCGQMMQTEGMRQMMKEGEMIEKRCKQVLRKERTTEERVLR
jgi:hypothetical protein